MRRASILLLLLALGGAITTRAELPEITRSAMESIRASQLVPTIRFLSSDRLEGRESGERGARIAADYIVSRFQAAGLQAGTKEGFVQRFDLRWRVLAPEVSFVVERGQADATVRREWQVRRDYFPLTFSEQGEVKAPIVFAGYGISAPEHDWDDYASLSRGAVQGKIVLLFRHEPDEFGETDAKRFDGGEMTLHASLRQKVRVARDHGAVGVILVDDPLHHDIEENPSSSLSRWRTLSEQEHALPDDDPVRFRGRPGTRDEDKPLGLVAVHASQQILYWLDPARDWEELQRKLDAGESLPTLTFDGVKAHLVHRWEASYRRASNVIAKLPGSDPELADEYVLIGGHMDHVGKDEDSGEIYNGADDNASGTAAIIAVAEAFASMPTPPKRSLIFALWGAEEKGLLGSDWFVHHPPIDLEKVVAGINLDMVGRNDEDKISVVGRTETPDLVALFDRFAVEVGLELNDDAGAGAGRSDNASLWLAGIPTAGLFSGVHDDYHKPSDTVSKIVPGKVERASRLSFLVMHAVATGEETPQPLGVPEGPWDAVAPESRLIRSTTEEGE